MNKDLEIIEGRIEVLFKRVPGTQYRINVVNDLFDHTYDFFFQSQPQHQRIKSVPLHTYHEYDLSKLELLIEKLQEYTALSIEYTGFAGQKWPNSGKAIQTKVRHDEN
ncbi:acetyl-CoA carboxylase [Pediococcus acidilactici]|uniref:acetyl-CoA carboxylase n=1 Tax=Pediococcus acidilactici TaxID=1254 RepID=UPI001F3C1FE0|nr:acetyl-CoA carboxylase [Pediococcus acidilactici]